MNAVIEKKSDPRFGLNDKMPFGKYQYLSIGELIDRDPNYVAWALNHIGAFILDERADAEYRKRKFW